MRITHPLDLFPARRASPQAVLARVAAVPPPNMRFGFVVCIVLVNFSQFSVDTSAMNDS
jgi:hypothetical protein